MTHPAHPRKVARLIAAFTLAVAEVHAADPPPARRIVVRISDRKLLLLEDDRVRKTYDIAVGTPSTPTPQGEFRIVNRIPHPTWYNAGRAVPPGRHNPLGTRWLGLSASGYGIHGTNNPDSIGKAASHGCIRMRNRDVEELFELAAIGVPVQLQTEQPAVKQLTAAE